MPQPVPPEVTSPPSQPGQPYDPCADSTAPFRKLEDNAGPADIHTGRVTGGFADDAPWRQV